MRAQCGGKVAPIIYGYPNAALAEAADRGEVALGGCVLPFPDDDLRWRCVSCSRGFLSDGSLAVEPTLPYLPMPQEPKAGRSVKVWLIFTFGGLALLLLAFSNW